MNFHFDKAFEVFTRTFPFVLLRLGVYALALVVSVLWFVGVYLLFVDWPFPGPPWLAWVIGGLLWGKGASLVREYILYLVKAAHIAVITRFVLSDGLPEGYSQLSFGKDIVSRHFVRVSLLFAVDRLVRRVLKAFNRSVFSLISWLPSSGSLRNFVQRVLDYSIGYVDEAILSYSIIRPEENPWRTARDGLILYGQNWKSVLGTGVVLALISYAIVGAFAIPGFLFAYATVGPLGKVVAGAALALGLLAKFIFMDPFALTTVIVNYHLAIAGQQVDPRWSRRFEEVTDRFKEFEARARDWGPSHSGPPPVPKQV